MEQLTDLKAILHSKRVNVYYLEYCRVMQKDGRMLYLTEAEKQNQCFNNPIENNTVLLLGNGSSVTLAAEHVGTSGCVGRRLWRRWFAIAKGFSEKECGIRGFNLARIFEHCYELVFEKGGPISNNDVSGFMAGVRSRLSCLNPTLNLPPMENSAGIR
jgi:hypothetical protein